MNAITKQRLHPRFYVSTLQLMSSFINITIKVQRGFWIQPLGTAECINTKKRVILLTSTLNWTVEMFIYGCKFCQLIAFISETIKELF